MSREALSVWRGAGCHAAMWKSAGGGTADTAVAPDVLDSRGSVLRGAWARFATSGHGLGCGRTRLRSARKLAGAVAGPAFDFEFPQGLATTDGGAVA